MEKLTQQMLDDAARKFDGHITNGSSAAVWALVNPLLKQIEELETRAEHWENEAHTLGHIEYGQRAALRQLAEIILAEHKGCNAECPQKEAALAAMKYVK